MWAGATTGIAESSGALWLIASDLASFTSNGRFYFLFGHDHAPNKRDQQIVALRSVRSYLLFVVANKRRKMNWRTFVGYCEVF
jgi:hypothetical protein